MSIRAMSKVWAHFPDGGSRLLLMLALADHAHDDGSEVRPGLESMAKKVRMSKGQARRVLYSLIDDGWIVRVKGGNRSGVAVYRMDLDRLEKVPDGAHQSEPPERCADSAHLFDGKVRASRPERCAPDAQNANPTYSDEPSEKHPSPPQNGAAPKDPYPEDFIAFWKAYPRTGKKDKPGTLKAWRKAIREGADKGTILARAKEYAKSAIVLTGYCRNAKRFLEESGWEDDRVSWHRVRGGVNQFGQDAMVYDNGGVPWAARGL